MHDCWPGLCSHVSAMTETHLVQAPSSFSSTVSHHVCYATVVWITLSSFMPPLSVHTSSHTDIVTYVHCSCTGNAPFCIYY